MIRYTCDLCKRDLDPEDDLRYVVKIEISAVFDPIDDSVDEDRDHLQEVHDILERLEDAEDDEIADEVHQQMRFDLCPECRKQFVRRPLGLYDFNLKVPGTLKESAAFAAGGIKNHSRTPHIFSGMSL